MDYENLPTSELIRLLKDYDQERAEAGKDGIILSYSGRTAPWQIIRLVKPKLSSICHKLSVGDESFQAQNMVIEGENLSAMVSLYKYRGQVDLILTDPPYNTGNGFRYNDKWDKDPNDPDLGEIVREDDGSRHSKWLRFMTPRIWMMREMLKPGGVLAICIDHRELYRLGMLMDEIFREENFIGIINWQKSYSPKNDSKHMSTATEYVLVYAKDLDKSKTGLLDRTEAMDARYRTIDGDPLQWKSQDVSAKEVMKTMFYAIQSPFTGKIYYPNIGKTRHWGHKKSTMKKWLEEWGSKYEEKDIGDGNFSDKKGKSFRAKALILQGCRIENGEVVGSNKVLLDARKRAQDRMAAGVWPELYFGNTGEKGPQLKLYHSQVKKGKVPISYWADENYDLPMEIESQSWGREESGHSQTGIKELDAIVGKGHNFETVKPLMLFKKIIQLWCRPEGIVLDPFAGSGTTAHAVLTLNSETESARRFILIEQGNSEKGDLFARSLTSNRVRRVITGDWAEKKAEPLPGGFRYIKIKNQKIDADAVNALAREEMVDLLLTSYWDRAEKAKSYLKRFPAGQFRFLFGVNPRNEGFYLVWEPKGKPSMLTRDVFRAIVDEAKINGASSSKYHIYASSAPYSGHSVEFYKIPDKVLEHIGFNVRSDAYYNEPVEV